MSGLHIHASRWARTNRLRMLAIAAIAIAAAQAASAQEQGNVGSLVSDLYGGDGIRIAAGNAQFPHTAHFTAESAEQLNDLNRVLSANIGNFAFNSAVSGVTFDVEQGVPVRSDQSLGPIIGERAATIGRGRVNVGASYTIVDYKQLDGRNLNDLSLELDHQDIPNQVFPFENDHVHLDLDLNLKQQVLALSSTYGLTDRIDIGIVVPIINIEGSVSSVATVEDMGGGGIHQFDPSGESPIDRNSADATGVGDILLRGKWRVAEGLAGTPLDAAIVGQVALPTGDKDDLLGTGSTAIYAAAVISGEFGKVSPHMNLGYEYFTDEDEAVGIERSNTRLVLGFDINARSNLAFSADMIGRWEKDEDKYYDIALGAKWAPFGDSVMSFNAIMPLNRNDGLRADVVFQVGFETSF